MARAVPLPDLREWPAMPDPRTACSLVMNNEQLGTQLCDINHSLGKRLNLASLNVRYWHIITRGQVHVKGCDIMRTVFPSKKWSPLMEG